jgi:hypothetical protein
MHAGGKEPLLNSTIIIKIQTSASGGGGGDAGSVLHLFIKSPTSRSLAAHKQAESHEIRINSHSLAAQALEVEEKGA